jgi:hypothetical protein
LSPSLLELRPLRLDIPPFLIKLSTSFRVQAVQFLHSLLHCPFRGSNVERHLWCHRAMAGPA